MIRGFKDNKTTTAEEWLMDYSLRTGNSIDINTDLLEMPIKFDGKEVDAFILDVLGNKLIIQLALPIATKFDDKSSRYEISYARKLINSKDFLSRFNPKFVKHIQPTKVNTEDYVTNDKFWLLSHEEVSQDIDFLKTNDKCWLFDLFEHVDLQSYSEMLLKLNKQQCYGWWLRSTFDSSYDGYVGCVYYYGLSYNYCTYYASGYLLLPACTIC